MERITNLFRLHDTDGLSLADSLTQCAKRGVGVDWADFYSAAKRAGWAWATTSRVVREAIADSGWHETFMDTVRSVFREVCGLPETPNPSTTTVPAAEHEPLVFASGLLPGFIPTAL